jgi:hypothetical protein
LWDTSGQEDYDQLRNNAYSGASVVIICFIIEAAPNYDQIRKKWIVEVRERCPATGCILVGIEPDGAYKTSRIDVTRGKRLAQEVDALYYVQCNLESGAGVDDVFEAVSQNRRQSCWAMLTSGRQRGLRFVQMHQVHLGHGGCLGAQSRKLSKCRLPTLHLDLKGIGQPV